MKIARILLILVVGLSFSDLATANDTLLNDVAEVSFVDTGGNTDTTSLVVKNTLKYQPHEKWQTTWGLKVLFAESDGVKTGENYITDLRLDYRLNERLYSFGLAAWLRDRFAGINNRYYFGAGLGYSILNGPKHNLAAEAGANYTIEEFTDKSNNGFLGARAFTKYDYLFTEKSKFTAWVEYLPDFKDTDNYNFNTEASLTSALNNFLSLKGSYLVKYDNKPAVGATEKDTIVSLALVMNLI